MHKFSDQAAVLQALNHRTHVKQLCLNPIMFWPRCFTSQHELDLHIPEQGMLYTSKYMALSEVSAC